MGDDEAARKLLAEMIGTEKQRVPDAYAYNAAAIYAYMDEADEAFEWIDRALETYPEPPVQAFMDIRYAGLLDDPRWDRVRELFQDFDGWDQLRR